MEIKVSAWNFRSKPHLRPVHFCVNVEQKSVDLLKGHHLICEV
jgi:hypothetical protein